MLKTHTNDTTEILLKVALKP